jgi:hypothetical protein
LGVKNVFWWNAAKSGFYDRRNWGYEKNEIPNPKIQIPKSRVLWERFVFVASGPLGPDVFFVQDIRATMQKTKP